MARRFVTFILAGAACLSGCAAHSGTRPQNASLDTEAIQIQKNIEDFRRENARYALPANDPLPNFESSHFKYVRTKTVLFAAPSQTLELDLGKRRATAPNSIFRTSSRYRLRTTTGKELAAAESLFAQGDFADSGGRDLSVFTDSESSSWFIAEDHSWATQRYIVITPHGAHPDKYQVRYVRVPEREVLDAPFSQRPEILGIKGNLIYLKMDNRLYAFPFDSLERVEKLEYSVG